MGNFRNSSPSSPSGKAAARMSQAGATRSVSKYERFDIDVESDPSNPKAVGLAQTSRRLLTECLSCFFLALVYTQCGIFITSLMLGALTFMAARDSQAHFSPAVTIAYWSLHVGTGQATSIGQVLGYIGSQVLGCTFGLLAVVSLFGSDALSAAPAPYAIGSAVALVAPTLIYILVHLAVLAEGTKTSFYGLAIGFALYAGVVAHGPGAWLLNPSLSMGNWLASFLVGAANPELLTTLTLANPLLNELAFLVITGLVGALAALIFTVCNGDGREAVLTTEAIGTYLSVLLVVATADEGKETSAQAVGLGFAAITYFGAEVSEAHYNPIITLAHSFTAEGMDVAEIFSYMGVQLIATIAACFTTFLVNEGLPAQELSYHDLTSTVGLNTLLFTFLVVFVHLNVIGAQGASTGHASANGFFGYSIGFAYLAGIWIFGGANGASAANPFLALGIHLAVGDYTDYAGISRLFFVPFLAAGLAAYLFNIVKAGAFRPTATQRDATVAAIEARPKGGFILTEVIGTCMLAFGLIASQDYGGETAESFGEAGASSGTAAGMDIGAIYIALTSALAYASGAAFNPAVSLAFAVQGNQALHARGLNSKDLFIAVGYQVLAAIAAFTLYGVLQPDWRNTGVLVLPMSYDPSTSTPQTAEEILGILIFSFALVLVHLNTVGDQLGNGFAGLAVGFTVLAGVLAFGDMATGLFNPCLPLGMYLSKLYFTGLEGVTPITKIPILTESDILSVGLSVFLPLLGAFLAVVVTSFNANPDRPAKLFTEGIGTFLIVLCLLKAPGSTGLVYVAIVYFGAHISQAHFNPAITLAHYLMGNASWEIFYKYAASQTIGAMIAGVICISEGDQVGHFIAADQVPLDWLKVFAAELLVSFAIVLVHLNVISGGTLQLGGELHAKKPSTNDYFGIAIGFTFTAGFMTVRSISGGVLNPAAGLGLFLARCVASAYHYVSLMPYVFFVEKYADLSPFETAYVGATFYYIIAPCIGAFFACNVFQHQAGGGSTKETPADVERLNDKGAAVQADLEFALKA